MSSQASKPKDVEAWQRLFHELNSTWGMRTLQVALLIIILVLLPKIRPPSAQPVHHTIQELQHAGSKYAIVFDAGSTGSRVHVFKFARKGEGLQLISDTFEQLKPGLSSYADDPKAAADSLKPLMEKALQTVPKELQVRHDAYPGSDLQYKVLVLMNRLQLNVQGTTPISLKATAGLRLLPGDKSEKILQAVKDYLKASPFSVSDNSVAILGGKRVEGGSRG